MRILLVFLGLCLVCQGQRSSKRETIHTCHPISIPMCQEMPYNGTKMPNLLQHRSQKEAAIMAHEFLPLVEINCSPHSRFFICSVFAPMCTPEIIFGVPACRSVCEAVRHSCLPVLMRLNFTWPSFLQCHSFPEEGLCMVPPGLQGEEPGSTGGDLSKKPNQITPRPNIPKNTISYSESQDYYCPGNKRVWVPANENDGVCAPLCGESFLFKDSDKRMAVVWAASWAMACFASTLFCILTFCLDTKRFSYPERPVICLALSYLFYCLPFIGRTMISPLSLSCEDDPSSGIRHLAASGSTSSSCIATFLLQYYFGFASDLWWTILTFCWFMSATRYWSSEGLASYATYFHLVAWGTPAIVTVLVIIFKQIDADELTGLCFVGNLRPSSLLSFVIIPQTILLSLGTTFIVCGFVSLTRIRDTIKRQSLNAASVSTSLTADGQCSNSPLRGTTTTAANHLGKLERLMIRLGVFSGLATVPAIFVLAFRIHFYFKYEHWVNEAVSSVGSSSCENGWNKDGCSYPRMVVSLFRIFMSLIVGVTSGIWVWSPKTMYIWKRTIIQLCELPSRFKKSYAAVPRSNFVRARIVKGRNNDNGEPRGRIKPPEEWSQRLDTLKEWPQRLNTSMARASLTSSGHYFQRNSESSYV